MKFAEALLVLFIALKLTGYIDWSWWLVMSPFLIPAAFAVVVYAYLVIKERYT